MSVKKLVNENRFIKEIRKQKVEYMLIFAIDADGKEVPYWKEKGSEKEVGLSSEGIGKMIGSTEYSRFIVVHNHPHAEDDKNYWYFSMQDIKFYQELREILGEVGADLMDFFVVSEKKTVSMKELIKIL